MLINAEMSIFNLKESDRCLLYLLINEIVIAFTLMCINVNCLVNVCVINFICVAIMILVCIIMMIIKQLFKEIANMYVIKKLIKIK